jgi:predicted metal-binding protein
VGSTGGLPDLTAVQSHSHRGASRKGHGAVHNPAQPPARRAAAAARTCSCASCEARAASAPAASASAAAPSCRRRSSSSATSRNSFGCAGRRIPMRGSVRRAEASFHVLHVRVCMHHFAQPPSLPIPAAAAPPPLAAAAPRRVGRRTRSCPGRRTCSSRCSRPRSSSAEAARMASCSQRSCSRRSWPSSASAWVCRPAGAEDERVTGPWRPPVRAPRPPCS